MDDVQGILTRARGYPYDYPRHSFIFSEGAVKPFDPALTAGRTPVLAFGSNQSPHQLKRKFGVSDNVIPVERVKLRDFDVVYAAHITSYGAVPAMLQRSPGTLIDVAISWLDEAQLEIMHKTELYAANYVFAALEGVTLFREDRRIDRRFYAYVGQRGHLVVEGGAVGLLAVHGENRRWPARSTGEMLEIIRERVAPETEPDRFILDLVADRDYRQSVTEIISRDEARFEHPYRVVTRY